MGDRTDVTLTLLNTQAEDAMKLFTFSHNSLGSGTSKDLCEFAFWQINYGDLGFLDDLQSAGIAFDSKWGSGSEYGPGIDSCRFTPEGSCIRKEIHDDRVDPPLYQLIGLINDPSALRDYILKHQEAITLLDWKNQKEYGQVYRALQLINPTVN